MDSNLCAKHFKLFLWNVLFLEDFHKTIAANLRHNLTSHHTVLPFLFRFVCCSKFKTNVAEKNRVMKQAIFLIVPIYTHFPENIEYHIKISRCQGCFIIENQTFTKGCQKQKLKHLPI